jgi:gamma-glutamylcyclotransferase (GGCT)/AIG2-like uncharacterized protein YtfP
VPVKPVRLFLYGTLMAGQPHPLARRLRAVLGPGEPVVIGGRMFAVPDPLGWYPVVVPGDGIACGMVHRADGLDDAMLAALDAYEEVVATGAGYRRIEVAVPGVGPAQAYVWQGALPEGALALEDGDFAAFLACSGRRAFGAQDS